MDPDVNDLRSSPASQLLLQSLGAELVFTHDQFGQYLSFYWSEAERYHLTWEQVVHCRMKDTFSPMPLTPYLDRVQRVLESLIPERFSYPFQYQDLYFPFDLVVSPILTSQEKISQVLVLGRLLPNKIRIEDIGTDVRVVYPAWPANGDLHQSMLSQIAGSVRRTLPPSSDLYQKIYNQISQEIHRTLDLTEIWQQTVNSLGQFLGVSRCFICADLISSEDDDFSERLANSVSELTIVAEYCQPEFSSLLGLTLEVESQPGWRKALETLAVVVVPWIDLEKDSFERRSVLVIATSYQDQPNGLIGLEQCDQERNWTLLEREFVEALAKQVGVAIAHATLYQELESAKKAAEALSELKSQFLANTSHELRTPLNGMIGFLRLVLDGMADEEEEEREFIQEAYNSALHLLNLINDILDIAKIEAGKMQIDLDAVNLHEVLSKVEEFTRPQMQRKGLSLQIEKLATESEMIVYGNGQRLLQIFFNLVGNAIKFTHQGGISIRFIVKNHPTLFKSHLFPQILEVRVTDTGIGVPVEKQDRLFQLFSQVDGGRTRQYGGTGLGLTISQKLVEAMGGNISFYSQGEGLGSTVSFTIPLVEPIILGEEGEE